MPRLNARLIHEAFRVHPLLPLLLPECRSVANARVEFRWLQNELSGNYSRLRLACIKRFNHYPLQYILGTQPFGDLNIRCKRHVLIPRWETEEWAMELSRCFSRIHKLGKEEKIKIVDLCTGTACIPLLLKYNLSALHSHDKIDVTAIDISADAISLAEKNCLCATPENVSLKLDVIQRDILTMDPATVNLSPSQKIELLTCNPPYISKRVFTKDVAKSVKLFEPHLALIGDKEFYLNLVDVWLKHIRSFVYEVGSMEQIDYVKDLIERNPDYKNNWAVGMRNDSNGHPRVVFGFETSKNTANYDMEIIFKDFGTILYSPHG